MKTNNASEDNLYQTPCKSNNSSFEDNEISIFIFESNRDRCF